MHAVGCRAADEQAGRQMYSQGLVKIPTGDQLCCIAPADLHGGHVVKPAPVAETGTGAWWCEAPV